MYCNFKCFPKAFQVRHLFTKCGSISKLIWKWRSILSISTQSNSLSLSFSTLKYPLQRLARVNSLIASLIYNLINYIPRGFFIIEIFKIHLIELLEEGIVMQNIQIIEKSSDQKYLINHQSIDKILDTYEMKQRKVAFLLI